MYNWLIKNTAEKDTPQNESLAGTANLHKASVSSDVTDVATTSGSTNDSDSNDTSIHQQPIIIMESETEQIMTESPFGDVTDDAPKTKIAKIGSASTSKKRVYKFNNEWLDDPELKDWVKKSKFNQAGKQEMAYCKLCNTNIFPHKNDLLRHNKSEKHQKNFKQVIGTQNIKTMLMPCSDGVKNAELKLCGLLATNNLPFSLMDTLSSLCTNIFSDSEIAKNLKVRRTKSTAIMREVLGKNFKEELHSQFRNEGNFFSLIMDETTDVGTVKQCAFSIIYFSKVTNKVTTSFFDMVETAKSDADSLYGSLKKCLADKKIPLTNMVGFSSDRTNVMVGEYHSVFSHLKEDLPDIVCVKCSCHMIHLAASKACLQLPRSVEDMLRNIGSHFSRSYSRQEKLKEFQQFFKTDIHKILLPSVTRWLSVQQCTNRVLEQYEVLRAYFRETTFEDPSKTNDEVLKCLDNSFTKIYLEFMSYVLEILNDFNTLFQSEVPLLHKLKPEVTRVLKILYSNYVQKQYFEKVDVFSFQHKNPRHFLPIENIYIGIAAYESIQNLKSDPSCKAEIELFFKTCLKFYIELISDIKSRFVFEDPLYDLISIVNPDFAQSCQTNSLLSLMKRFSFLKNFIVPQKLDNEWREHSLLNYSELGLGNNLPPELYWPMVFQLKNAADIPLFPNLQILIALLLILPFSNASVERIFSKLNIIKTDHRNKLKTETITALLYTKDAIENQGGCINFTPSKKMLLSKIWSD